MHGAARPGWDPAFCEIGLVALQAAVLARRIFTPPTRRGELRPEQHQILMALALIDSAPYQHPTSSVEGLATQLTLDRDDVGELLFDLMTAGYVEVAVEGEESDPAAIRLSARGWTAAHDAVERAGRFLPGWPPAVAPDRAS
jgi:hypothetical protein